MEEYISPVPATEVNRVKQVARYKPAKAVAENADEKAREAAEKEQKAQKKERSREAAKMAEEANKRVKLFNTRIQFKHDPEHRRNIIIVSDKDTGEIIRQIPAKEMLSLMDKMEEIEGIIFNRSV